MTVDEFLRHFPDIEISPECLVFCRYLESQGEKFLEDFGYGNAEEKAWLKLEETIVQ
jgi:hypothetical protein